MHTLYTLCKENCWKMLLLSNRNILKKQLEWQYGDQFKSTVTLMNYQKFTQLLKFKSFDKGSYQVIVSDEAHFFFQDAPYNNESDITLNYLSEKTDSLVLFLSATCSAIYKYLEDKWNFSYQFLKPYKFAKYFYWNNIDVIKKFLINLPENEKAIYFCRNIDTAYSLHKEMPECSSFICSQNNAKYASKSNTETLKQITEREMFDCKILFTTTVLDNGINLHDPFLKHIIIDLYDFDAIIQCIGRRRIDDEVNLPNIYIAQYTQSHLQSIINTYSRVLEPITSLTNEGLELFERKYNRKNLHGLLYTESTDGQFTQYKVNKAKEYRYRYEIKLAQAINQQDTKFGHLKYLCELLSLDFAEFQDLSKYYTAITLNDKLDSYIGKRLFGTDKTRFVELLKKNVLTPLVGGYKVNTVNNYFDNIQLPYVVKDQKVRERKSPYYNKRYWLLQEKMRPE